MINSLPRPPSHFCGLVVVRSDATGKVDFLVIDYSEGGFNQVKFPGGCSKQQEVPFVDMLKTLRRETGEELGDDQLPSKHQVTISLDDTSLEERRVAKVIKSSGHCQYFYLVADSELSGTLRQREIFDGNEKLGVPRWVDADGLTTSIFRSHHTPLIAALMKLSECDEKIKQRYAKLL